jgi:hypothetical protein
MGVMTGVFFDQCQLDAIHYDSHADSFIGLAAATALSISTCHTTKLQALDSFEIHVSNRALGMKEMSAAQHSGWSQLCMHAATKQHQVAQ